MNNKQLGQCPQKKIFAKFCEILPHILANAFRVKMRIVELNNNIS